MEEIVVKMTCNALYFAAALLAVSMCAAASVVINEIEVNPPEGGVNWLEIYNSGNESVDISGWTAEIVDGSWVGKFDVAPNATILPSRGFYVFTGEPSWNHNDGGYAVLYSASGEEVDRSASRQDTMNNDFTYGRNPDGYDTNSDGDWGLSAGSKGSSNA